MSEEKPEESKEGQAKDSLHEVMAGGGFYKSPLFWGLLIFIPIALALLISVNKARKDGPDGIAAIEKAVEQNQKDKPASAKPLAGRGR